MSLRMFSMRVAAAGCAAIVTFAAGATGAAAQQSSSNDSVFFMWGGDSEWGGKRQSVKFDAKYKRGDIIVSFGDRRLYLVTAQGTAMSYPIAVPREKSRWEGTTSVSMKRENPSWVPTPTMISENPRLPSYVPGGHPMNPLGVRALYLGSSTYRIHGTDAPWTIGQAVSKGCIRMFNEDVLDLYQRVPVGSKVVVTWQRYNASEVASTTLPPTATATPPTTETARTKTATTTAATTTSAYSPSGSEAYEVVDGRRRTLYGRRAVGTRSERTEVQ